jgi:hypothetical protein
VGAAPQWFPSVQDESLFDDFGDWAQHVRDTGNAGAHGEEFDPVTMGRAMELQVFISPDDQHSLRVIREASRGEHRNEEGHTDRRHGDDHSVTYRRSSVRRRRDATGKRAGLTAEEHHRKGNRTLMSKWHARTGKLNRLRWGLTDFSPNAAKICLIRDFPMPL